MFNLIKEINFLAVKISNNETSYRVWVEYAGHVDSLQVRLGKEIINNYDEYKSKRIFEKRLYLDNDKKEVVNGLKNIIKELKKDEYCKC